MFYYNQQIINFSKKFPFLLFTTILIYVLGISGCSVYDPPIELPDSPPYSEDNSYTEALYELGMMSEIYNIPLTKFQSTFIMDDTGASLPLATGAEIQRDITEIVKSTLNSIGGSVLFIEYAPTYISNQIATGYSKFENKIAPDVVVTGGITGFDRGMMTKSGNMDFGIDLQFPEIQNEGTVVWPPSTLLSTTYNDAEKEGLARITLDFNLKNFQTLAGVPYMTTTNSMLVHKRVKERDWAITLFGPTFGVKGSTKLVQGRHQAVRVLVQSCMLNLVGRYMAIPYWRLMGEETKPDRIVMLQLRNSYSRMSDFDRLVKTQMWLYMHGYDIDITGDMDDKTKASMKQFSGVKNLNYDPANPKISLELFRTLYINIPLTDDALMRRIMLNRMLS